MGQEVLKVFFYDVRCAVVMHFSAKMATNGSEKAFCVERTRLSCWCL